MTFFWSFQLHYMFVSARGLELGRKVGLITKNVVFILLFYF